VRVYLGGVATETNMFCPFPTGRSDWVEFAAKEVVDLDEPAAAEDVYPQFLDACKRIGIELYVGYGADAQPAGPTPQRVYEELRSKLLDDVLKAAPVDVVILKLHGAMVAHGYDDCEADMINRVRERVGKETVIGVLLDPHCHLSQEMVDGSDVIMCYREYPHVDVGDRLIDLLELCVEVVKGSVNPVASICDCRMISAYYTNIEPMKSFVAKMKQAEEEDDVLSLSLAHGFPWADTPDVGTKMLVITNNNKARGEELADEFRQSLFSLRGKTFTLGKTISEAVDIVRSATEFPIVFSDWSDVPGGGAPSDYTEILESFIAAGIRRSFFALFYDPGAVAICMAAGECASLRLRLGGKICWASGNPLDLDVKIVKIVCNAGEQVEDGWHESFGNAVLVEAAGNLIVLNDTRNQPRTLETITQFDLDPTEFSAIVLKSMHHFQEFYSGVAARIESISGHGLLNQNFESIDYRRILRPKWPLDDQPF
jgi:microcystin degradation protein MlrC